MSETKRSETKGTEASAEPAGIDLEIGGLQFNASFRGPGATLRVSGPVDGHRQEMIRFDDFIEAPHYHVPAAGDAIMFDRDTLGVPLDWYVAQIRDHLGELLTTAGYGEALSQIDLQAVTDNADKIEQVMVDCVPDGFVRVPGVGLQKADA